MRQAIRTIVVFAAGVLIGCAVVSAHAAGTYDPAHALQDARMAVMAFVHELGMQQTCGHHDQTWLKKHVMNEVAIPLLMVAKDVQAPDGQTDALASDLADAALAGARAAADNPSVCAEVGTGPE